MWGSAHYDEDLNQNRFLQEIQQNHVDLLWKCCQETGSVILVPRCDSVTVDCQKSSIFDKSTIFDHVLYLKSEVKREYVTQSGKSAFLNNQTLTIIDDNKSKISADVLFAETFYLTAPSDAHSGATSGVKCKYIVWCISKPLVAPLSTNNDMSTFDSFSNAHFDQLESAHDCVDFLWLESEGHAIFDRLNDVIRDTARHWTDLQLWRESVAVQKDLIRSIYEKCREVALNDDRLMRKSDASANFRASLNLAIETYVQQQLGCHGNQLMMSIGAILCVKDAMFNKIVQNHPKFDSCQTPISAKQCLGKLNNHLTAIDKLNCLKKTLNCLTVDICNDSCQMIHLTSDEILQNFVNLILNVNLNNWVTNLTFLKQFRFSCQNGGDCQSEDAYIIATLEAAIEFIRAESVNSGQLLSNLSNDIRKREDLVLTSVSDSLNDQNTIVKFQDYVLISQDDILNQSNSLKCQNIVKCQNDIPKSQNDSCNNKNIIKCKNENLKCQKDGMKNKNDSVKCQNDSQICQNDSSINKNIAKCQNDISTCQNESPKAENVILTSKVDNLNDRLCHPLCTCQKCTAKLPPPPLNILENPLLSACRCGNAQLVEKLLRDFSVTSSNVDDTAPLLTAASSGHQDVLLLLVHHYEKSGKDINEIRDNGDNTILHLTTNNGHVSCVKAVIYSVKDLKIDARNRLGESALFLAVKWGYIDIINALLQNGADVNLTNNRGQAVREAAPNYEILSILSNDYEQLTTIRSNRYSKVSVNFITEQVVTEDLAFGVRPRNSSQFKKVDLLLKAIANDDVPLACFYLGFKLTDTSLKIVNNAKQCHPLCNCKNCSSNSDFEQMNFDKRNSVDESVNINICNGNGLTPLHIAAKYGRKEILRLLLDAGANSNVQTYKTHFTPLIFATINGHINVVRELLNCGDCQVDKCDFQGHSALYYACMKNDYKLVEVLVNNGADCGVRNTKTGKSLVQELTDKGNGSATSQRIFDLICKRKQMLNCAEGVEKDWLS